MWDQLGEQMPPEPGEATTDIVDYILGNKHKYPNIRIFDKDILTHITFDYYSNNRPLWSLAAWYMGGMEDYADIVTTKYHKKCTSRKKIKAIIKTCALLYLYYRNTIEKRYMPGGAFETEKALIWNPILNPNRPTPPPPSVFPPPPPPNSPKNSTSRGSGINGIRILKHMQNT